MRQETPATSSSRLLVREMGERWCGSFGGMVRGKSDRSILTKHGLNSAYDPAGAGSRIRSREA